MKKNKTNGVRKILLMGVFWRILFIEAVLLVYSLFYRWATEDAGAADLFWYAVRIIVLVTIIIVFMMITLKNFLTEKIIQPLESLAEANKKTQKDYTKINHIDLPDNAPDEIRTLVTSRTDMLKKIINVSEERLNLVNFIKDTFGRYLSKKVVDEILTSPKGAQIGGSRKTVTILMSDLRGFTNISEDKDPEEMVQLLNRYLGEMSRIIHKYDGIIDELIGDAILAVFGAPESHGNDPERAVACAIEMQNSLVSLNQEITASGSVPLEMGIGINTGQVIVGNIGSRERMKYGIVGDTVNRASRIESNSVGGQILIGQSTFDKVQGMVDAQPPVDMMMKGLKKPLVFYSVTAIKTPDFSQTLQPQKIANAMTDIRIPFICWPILDKKITEIPISGETLSMDQKNIYARTATPLPPYTDVKLELNFCIDAHCFDVMYAKTTQDKAKGNSTTHFSITAMEEKDRALLARWIDQASG
ncbi:MAG: adenylate/guanylate cyclase domain-containing protein [Desulfobacterales bacterium]|nr:adenylate/guanylate cyclase domain-containing protein [Desulfobacterales bacterium]